MVWGELKNLQRIIFTWFDPVFEERRYRISFSLRRCRWRIRSSSFYNWLSWHWNRRLTCTDPFRNSRCCCWEIHFLHRKQLLKGSTILSALGRTMPFASLLLKNSTKNSVVLISSPELIHHQFSRTFSSKTPPHLFLKKTLQTGNYGTVL